MNCRFCGAEIPDNALFCTECGKPVEGAVPAPQEVPAEPAADEAVEPVVPVEDAVVEPEVTGEPAFDEAAQEPVEAAGEAVEAVGETAEAAGEAVEAAGEAVEDAEAPYVGVEFPDETAPEGEAAGEAAEAAGEAAGEAAEEPVYGEAAAEEAPAPKEKKKLGTGAKIGIVVLLLAILGGIGGGVYYNNLKKAYEEASALYDAGNYAEAAEAFTNLGKFQDSADRAALAGLWDAAEKAEKAAGETAEGWEKAEEAYSQIPTDITASAKAAHCHDMATYYKAADLLASDPENPEVIRAAMEQFQNCGGVLDSADQVTELEYRLAYIDAKAIFESGDWNKAIEALTPLAENGYRDAAGMKTESETHISYEKAEKLFKDKKYYDAYKAYNALKGKSYEWLPDMAKKAKACIQKTPATGEVYHNPNYTNNTTRLTIDNSGYMNTFVKLYIGKDLISTVYIPADKEATFWLPAGTYKMNKAYGNDWFGTEDLFGDEGYYWTCTFAGKETFTLESGYGYKISSGGEGTSINTKKTNRKDL